MLSTMDTPDESPKPLSPIRVIGRVVVGSAAAIYYLWTGIDGLVSGTTTPVSRYDHHHILMQQSPDSFWFLIVLRFIAAAVLLYLVFQSAAKLIRQK